MATSFHKDFTNTLKQLRKRQSCSKKARVLHRIHYRPNEMKHKHMAAGLKLYFSILHSIHRVLHLPFLQSHVCVCVCILRSSALGCSSSYVCVDLTSKFPHPPSLCCNLNNVIRVSITLFRWRFTSCQ